MHQRRRTLSIDDQKAVDVCLDHAAAAGDTKLMRVIGPVAQHRLTATTKLLSILEEWVEADPPAGLVERTLKRIEDFEAGRMEHGPVAIPHHSIAPTH